MSKVFVAFPFRPDTQAIVDDIIRPVLLREGLRCVTGHDREEDNSELLLGGLRKSIADCSALIAVVIGRNPNVFFEIGVATTLEKPCILLGSAASDAAMLQGIYPLVTTSAAKPAMQELREWLRSFCPLNSVELNRFVV